MSRETRKKHFLPTLALLWGFLPAVVAAVLIALSAGGNWAFLILALIVSPIAEVILGGASLIPGIFCIRKGWSRKRGIAAVILSGIGLAVTLVAVGSFWLRGMWI